MSSIEELKQHPLWPYREDYVKSLRSIEKKDINLVDNQETVTLYHGTTTAYLNDILSKGILTRNETGTSNWELQSVENFTYLTNKWHYYYAYKANEEYLVRIFGEDFADHPRGQWWRTLNPLPCYIECKVPKALLFADEDMILSRYYLQKLKNTVKKAQKLGKEEINIELTWEDSLSQYGTVAAFGSIPPEYIHSFTVLGEPKMYLDLYENEGPYMKDFHQWQSGNGKGKRFDALAMMKRETNSDLNGTFWLKDMKGKKVKGFVFNPRTKKIAINLT